MTGLGVLAALVRWTNVYPMNRLVGCILALTWIVAMTALVQRDVLPFWTARDAPDQLLPVGDYQVGIFNQASKRIGTTWITTSPMPMTMIRSTTVLDAGKISGSLPISGTWILSTDLVYGANDRLEQFKLILYAPGLTAEVDAERIEREFSVLAKVGEMKKTLILDGELSKYLSDSLRPFTHLGGLHVGQSWRIRLLDPFALIQGRNVEFQTQLAQVKSMETISSRGREVECFRVETPSATAWADANGRVLVQEVQLPLLGRWTLTDEPVDVTARRNIISARNPNSKSDEPTLKPAARR